MAVRAMLARLQRLEQARGPVSPFGPDWEVECWAGIDAGLLDRSDTPVVIAAVRRWQADGVWTR